MLTASEAATTLLPAGARRCRVCGGRSDGAHFGVDACRACAAFFRRSVAMNKKYVCRAGSQRCSLDNVVRTACRRCRYIKCQQAGMLPEMTRLKSKQQHRSSSATSGSSSPILIDDPMNTPDDPEEKTSSTSPCSAFPATSFASVITSTSAASSPPAAANGSSSIIRFSTGLPLPASVKEEQPTTPQHVTPNFSTIKSNPELSLLLKLEANYKEMYLIEQSIEYAIVAFDKSTLFREEGNRHRVRESFLEPFVVQPARHAQVNEIFKATLMPKLRFATASFDEIADLSKDEQWTLYQNFLLLGGSAESFYRTVRFCPENVESRLFTSLTTQMDLDKLEEYFGNADAHLRDPTFQRALRAKVELLRDSCVPFFARLNLCDIELIALITLLLWSPNAHNATDRVRAIGEKYCKRVLHELHVLYRHEFRLQHYSTRLGELLCLVSALEWSASQLRDELRMMDIFGMLGEHLGVSSSASSAGYLSYLTENVLSTTPKTAPATISTPTPTPAPKPALFKSSPPLLSSPVPSNFIVHSAFAPTSTATQTISYTSVSLSSASLPPPPPAVSLPLPPLISPSLLASLFSPVVTVLSPMSAALAANVLTTVSEQVAHHRLIKPLLMHSSEEDEIVDVVSR